MATPEHDKTIILDGGMSRELMRLEAPFRQPEWSALALLEAPHLVQQVHTDFASAGADVLTTNSYALVPFHIGSERFNTQGQDLASLAGSLARKAADQNGPGVRVAGSLPPIFGSYEPEKFDASSVQDYLKVLVAGLAPHVDVWLGETLSLIAEGEAVQTAVAGTEKPIWIAFTLDDESGSAESTSPRLRSGESVVDAAKWAFDAGIEAMLFNCSRPEYVGAAIDATRAFFEENSRTGDGSGKVPWIGAYANAFSEESEGEAANVDISSTRAELDTKAYAAFAREWIARGANIVGGCCGIGREHIQQLALDFKSGTVTPS